MQPIRDSSSYCFCVSTPSVNGTMFRSVDILIMFRRIILDLSSCSELRRNTMSILITSMGMFLSMLSEE